ncbi:MAG: hypothetical protein JXQ29_18840 [Planctomycetes bacterium]|nr:hypothetical protein [Planctomycetota bacterium]
MTSDSLPPSELGPRLRQARTPARAISEWLDLMDLCERFLLGMLSRATACERERKDAYRRWYRERMEEHDQDLVQLCTTLAERSREHGR